MSQYNSLLVVLLVILFEPLCVRGQDCTWTNFTNIGGKNAPGSNTTFVVTSTKALSDGIFLTWTLNSFDVAQHSYSSSTSQFSTATISSRYIASITIDSADVVTTKLTIQNVQLNEAGQPVGIFRSNCPGSSGNGKTIPLVVQNCDKEFFNPNATASSPSSCGYGCTESFICNASSCFNGSFQRECLTNATWGSSLHSCTEITCDILPAFMRFPTGVLSITCGSSGTVECDGGSAMCGSTTATCLSTGGNVTLEDPNFSCSKTCDLGVFADVATSAHIAPRCGDSVHFECHRNSSCGQTFQRTCSRNGSWERLDHPCKKTKCNGTTIRSVCGNHCEYGNLTSLLCGERLNYTCTSGAKNTVDFPVYCIEENTLSHSSTDNGTICQLVEATTHADDITCSAKCNGTTIRSVCGSHCEYGNLTSLLCGERLNYTCTSGAVLKIPLIFLYIALMKIHSVTPVLTMVLSVNWWKPTHADDITCSD